MEMGRSGYEQPGTKLDGILSHQGGFPSKLKGMVEKQRGIGKGKQKAKGLHHNCVSTCRHVHTDCLTIECSDNHERVYVHINCLNC
jgi:hypothetical protein